MSLLALLILAQPMNLNTSGSSQPVQGAFGAAVGVQETIPLNLSFPYNVLDPTAVIMETDAGTVTADGGHAIMTVGTTGWAEIRSRLSARYIPGQGMSARFTFVSDKSCHSKQTLEIGAGDEVDGFAFGCCPTCGLDGGASFGVLRRSNSVDSWTPAARWNGAWGRTPPDITYGRPYQIQWQWLGYGQITYFIEDEKTGAFVTAHSIRYAGTAINTSISNPTLPLHAHALSSGSDAGVVLRVPSMAMVRQGDEPVTGRRFSVSGTRAVTTSETEVLTLKNDIAFGGRVNRTNAHVDFLAWSLGTSAGTADVIVRIRLNPVHGGPAWRPANTYSMMSYDTDGGFASNGTEWMQFVASEGLSGTIDLRPYELHMAAGDSLMVTGTSSTGAPVLRISLSWVEER